MSKSISKRLQVKVLDAMRTAGTPLTTSEISILVGKSYESTRQALLIVGAEKVDDSFPTKWRMSDVALPVEGRTVPSNFHGDEYTVSTKPIEGLVQAWNESRESLGASLASTEITPNINPKNLAVQLGTVAGSIAALAYKLDEYATRPDWFESITEER